MSSFGSRLFYKGDGAMTLKDLVERFCIQRLASVLWQCVEVSVTDRAELDWLTAEGFVKKNSHLVDRVLQTFVSLMPQPNNISGETAVEFVPYDTTYYTFVQNCGRTIWDYMYQPLKESLRCSYHPTPHYTYIRFG